MSIILDFLKKDTSVHLYVRRSPRVEAPIMDFTNEISLDIDLLQSNGL